MGLEPETFDILQLTGLWRNLRNLPVFFGFLCKPVLFFLRVSAFSSRIERSRGCTVLVGKKDIYLCSAQVDMVVIKGIVQSHCHHILDKTKSLSVASWLLLPIIVIHLVIGPAYYLFVIF